MMTIVTIVTDRVPARLPRLTVTVTPLIVVGALQVTTPTFRNFLLKFDLKVAQTLRQIAVLRIQTQVPVKTISIFAFGAKSQARAFPKIQVATVVTSSTVHCALRVKRMESAIGVRRFKPVLSQPSRAVATSLIRTTGRFKKVATPSLLLVFIVAHIHAVSKMA
jgi:hypothetical protein